MPRLGGDGLGSVRVSAAWSFQTIGQLQLATLHGLGVVDDATDVGEHVGQRALERGEGLLARRGVQSHVDPRFEDAAVREIAGLDIGRGGSASDGEERAGLVAHDAQDRVHHLDDRDAGSGEPGGDRLDQHRHVVGDDLQGHADGAVGSAVQGERGDAGITTLGELEMSVHHRGRVGSRGGPQHVQIDVPEVHRAEVVRPIEHRVRRRCRLGVLSR